MSIEIKNVSHIYNPNTTFESKALKNINITIEDGEFIGIIGHTGSGKSTLIQMLNGLIKPTLGKIIIDDADINSDKKLLKLIRQKVGIVFQYPEYQLFEMTVYKDVAFAPTNMGLDKKEIDKRVKKSLNLVGIHEDLYEKSPFEISGGQKRRVAIAGILAMDPKILVLDEPTAGLDPHGRDEILSNIKKLHNELNMTVILVSHSMEDISILVNKVIVLDKGEIFHIGTPETVFSKYEQLKQIGLNIPQTAYLMHELKKNGFNVPTNIFTVEEATKVIFNLFNKDIN